MTSSASAAGVPATGIIEAISITPVESDLPQPVTRIEVTETGLVGDRYATSGDITLIEAEALEAFTAETGIELSAAESRRQVLTRGIRLNDLVDVRFVVGDVECVGTELCEPCNHLQKLTRPGVLRGLVHRGGLRAAIVRAGRVEVGDAIAVLDSAD